MLKIVPNVAGMIERNLVTWNKKLTSKSTGNKITDPEVTFRDVGSRIGYKFQITKSHSKSKSKPQQKKEGRSREEYPKQEYLPSHPPQFPSHPHIVVLFQ